MLALIGSPDGYRRGGARASGEQADAHGRSVCPQGRGVQLPPRARNLIPRIQAGARGAYPRRASTHRPYCTTQTTKPGANNPVKAASPPLPVRLLVDRRRPLRSGDEAERMASRVG